MIEKVINRKNMQLACKQVLQNKGYAGVDGMETRELYAYLKQNREAIAQSIVSGSYLPNPSLA